MTLASLSRSMIVIATMGSTSSAFADVIVYATDPNGTFGCLAADGSDGDPIYVKSCTYGSDEHWRLQSNGALMLVGTDKCVNIPNGNYSTGTKLILWTCGAVSENARWIHTSDGSLMNPTSGKCIDVPGGTISYGSQVWLWDCHGTWHQNWGFNVAQ